ncbi:hypothetical protein MKW92_044503 [Papaver armeniacum]|nr:hypothetical protein MKW92_044503 [Papaver armeniacum]
MKTNISVHLILLINIIIALFSIELALSLDQRFEDCKPKNCGNGLEISYPFWIEKNYCGYSGFEVTCKSNEPILYASGYDYIIRDIDYVGSSVRVENSVAYGACPVPFRNSTFNNDQSPFKTGSKVQPISFFYNCTNFNHELHGNLIYPVNTSCVTLSDRDHFSFAGFVPSGDSIYDKLACQFSVNVPVEVESNLTTGGRVNGYLALLKKGFTLEWSKERCLRCEGSGGSCGVREHDLPVCFCKDGQQFVGCGIVFSLGQLEQFYSMVFSLDHLRLQMNFEPRWNS